MRDTREQFCFQYLGDLQELRACCPAKSLTSALAVYLTLTEHATMHYRNGGRDGFVVSRKMLADASGVSLTTLDKVTKWLLDAGLLGLERRREGTTDLPSRYCLSTSKLSDPPANDDPPKVGTSRAGDTATTRNRKKDSTKELTEPIGFSDWLAYHSEITGQRIPGASTRARATLARKFAELLGEGRTVEQIKLASLGAHSNGWLCQQGLTRPKNILVFDRIDGLAEDGEKARLVKPEPGRYTGRKRAEDQL